MYFSGSPARARLALLLMAGPSLGTASSGSSGAPPRLQPEAQQRVLALAELRLIRGGQMVSTAPGGVTTQDPASEPNAGDVFPWEGSVGELNTLSGNKRTQLPLVQWTARGGLAVDLSLYHNSAASSQSELGHHWTHSYAIYGIVEPTLGDFTVQWGDNLEYTFVRNLDGSFSPPEGIAESLTYDPAAQRYTLTRKGQVRYTFHRPNGVRWSCVAIADRNDNTVTIQHTAQDFVSQVTDPSGRTLAFHYAGAALTGVTDPLGRTFHFTQTGGELTQVAFPAVDGAVPTVTMAYNSAHNLTQLTNPLGKHWTFGYTPNGRALAWEKDPLLQTTHYSYTPGQTRITDPRGNVTVHHYDEGRLVRIEDPTQASVHYAYTGGYCTQVTDAEGNVTQLAYDARGNLLSTVDPQGNVTSLLYGPQEEPTQVTSPSGRRATLHYNARGNLIGHTNPLQQTTQFAVDAHGQLTAVTDPLGRVTNLSYDADGNRASVSDPLGRSQAVAFDRLGRPVRFTVGGLTAQQVYNSQGKVTQQIAPGNRVTHFTYDLAGNPLQKTDPLGQVEQLAYDDAGRLVRRTDALGRSVELGYDAVGNRVRFTDGRGKTTHYRYDSRNQLQQIAYPDGTAQHFAYSPRGLLTSRTDGRGVQVGLTHDALGNVTALHYSDGTPSVAFVFDSEGRRTSMTDGSGTTTDTYDAAGNLISHATPQGQVQLTYDAAGQLVRRVGGGTDARYTYNAAGQLVRLLEGGNQRTEYAYDALGRLVATHSPNGTVQTRTYGPLGELVQLESLRAGTVLTRHTYAYDLLGRKIGETTPEASVSYAFDAASQLLRESRVGLRPYTVLYSYDSAGNRTSRIVNGIWESYSYDEANKLLAAGGKLYAYDGAGNVTSITSSAGNATFTWDGESRLRQSTQAGSGFSYLYNGLGQRVGRSGGGQGGQYLFADNEIDAPVLSDGSASYTHGIAGLLSESRGGLHRSFHTDALGSIRAQSSATGALAHQADTDAFGVAVSQWGSSETAFGFAGSYGYQQEGPLGLVRVGHRIYDPTTGRFLSRDPIHAGSNWYVYADSDPLNAVDPDGLDRIVVGWEGWRRDKRARSPILRGRIDVLDDSDKILFSLPVESGGHGRGALPPGNYRIVDPPYRSSNPEATGGFFTLIDPFFRTPRTGLGIHFDGGVPGTEGCVGIKQWEDYQKWLDYLRKRPLTKKNPLQVLVKPLPAVEEKKILKEK